MATLYVDPDSTAGGTGITNALTGTDRAYASLAAWEAARQGTLTEVEECICCSNGGSHTADVSVAIDGWTTTASLYPDIKVDAASRHAGVWSDTKYRILSGSWIASVANSVPHARISGLQAQLAVNIDAGENTYTNGGDAHDAVFDGCIARANPSPSYRSNGFYQSWALVGNAYFRNCLVYDFDYTTGSFGFGLSGGDYEGFTYAYNCTAVNCGVGFAAIYVDHGFVYNCLAQGCDDGFNSTCRGDYNCSDIATDAPGANSRTGTVTFMGASDYHLSPSDTVARGYGTDLSASFTTDIDGETRPTGAGTWDIGADEYVAAAGGRPMPQRVFSGPFAGPCRGPLC